MPSAPKVFISHASDDKLRFVMPFATKLRENGIDAWVDQWEIKAGDSIVDKIFEEGIGNADAVIVVLSKISITKRWVREELDAAIVARIQKKARVIPLIIEECEIPVALQAAKWIKVDDGRMEDAVGEVVRTVFGLSSKPPLGIPPAYTAPLGLSAPGVDEVDTRVLLGIGELFVGGDALIDWSDLRAITEQYGLSDEQLLESLTMLESTGYIEGIHVIDGQFHAMKIQHAGAGFVLKAKYPDLDRMHWQIAAIILNDNGGSNTDLAKRLDLPLALIDFVFDELELFGHVRVAKMIGRSDVYYVSPTLRRALRDSGQ